MKEIKVNFKMAENLLQEGDVLLFRSNSIISFFIQRATEGQYSHVGLASSHGDNGGKIWECVEFREGYGGRTINLERYIQDYTNDNSFIDVYRASKYKKIYVYNKDYQKIEEQTIAVDNKIITNTMRKMTGLPYGWKRIAWIAQHKIPFLRLLYSMDSLVDDNNLDDFIYPVCSTAVAYSFSKTGYDLVNHRSDEATSPADIARSPLLSYIFTLSK